MLRPFDISPASRHHCCGSEGPYDPDSELCCESENESVIRHVEQTNIRESQCCGLNVINPIDTMCCNGVQHQRNPFYECCGSVTYNVSEQVCSDGSVFDIGLTGRAKLCGRTPYNPDNQHCCLGQVHDIGHGACCAQEGAYSPSSQHCCPVGRGLAHKINNIPTIKGITNCCGHESYLESSHMCCGGQLYRRVAGIDCCADGVYNTSTQLCCGTASPKTVVNKNSETDQCCGSDSYNPHSQTCCRGSVKAGRGECCYLNSMETQLYNPQTETCCQSEIHDAGVLRVTGNVYDGGQSDSMCCGSALLEDDQLCTSENNPIPKQSANHDAVCEAADDAAWESKRLFGTYNTATEMCTTEGVMMKPVEPLCWGRNYDIETRICCHGHLHIRISQDTECCSVQAYDNSSQSCFLDMVFDVNPMYARPCGDRLYDNRTHVCYQNFLIRDRNEALEYPEMCGVSGGALIPYRPDQHECCWDKLIGASYTCCDGQSWHTPGTALAEGACCQQPDGHSVGYNNRNELCCNGFIHPRNGPNVQCCGTTTYNNLEDLCCDGSLYKPQGQDLICTGSVAHQSSEIVCDGVKHAARPGGECCGRSLINKVSQICCQGIGYEKTSPEMQCCGRVPYSNTEKLCCGTSLFDISSRSNKCCGNSSYDSSTHTCHELRGESFLFHNDHHTYSPVCQNGNFDVTRHTCCEGLLHVNVVNGQCCGARLVHNPDTHLCCNGQIHEKTYEDTGCCGGKLYNSSIYTCCGDKTLWRHSQLQQCCNENIRSISEPCN